jgi:hypothetical protein
MIDYARHCQITLYFTKLKYKDFFVIYGKGSLVPIPFPPDLYLHVNLNTLQNSKGSPHGAGGFSLKSFLEALKKYIAIWNYNKNLIFSLEIFHFFVIKKSGSGSDQ